MVERLHIERPAWPDPDGELVYYSDYAPLSAYAHEATKAITGLTVGGSEYFGKQIGDIYTADLPRCVDHIRERMGFKLDAIRAEARAEKAEADVEHLRKERNEAERISRGWEERFHAVAARAELLEKELAEANANLVATSAKETA